MNQKANFKTVTLKDLWGIFVQRLWAIILAACICCGGFLVFNCMTFIPQYASTATLYILRQADVQLPVTQVLISPCLKGCQ